MVECRTPEREVRGSRPTSAVLCPWARHFTPRKYWLITQEAMAPSRHDWKIVDWDVKPQHNQLQRAIVLTNHFSKLMRLWYFSSFVKSFFKRACAAIQWATYLIFGRTLPLLPYFMFPNNAGLSEPSLVTYVIRAIIFWAGSFVILLAWVRGIHIPHWYSCLWHCFTVYFRSMTGNCSLLLCLKDTTESTTSGTRFWASHTCQQDHRHTKS